MQRDSALPWLALCLTVTEDVIEELPTPAPVRATLTKLEQPAAEQRNLGGGVADR